MNRFAREAARILSEVASFAVGTLALLGIAAFAVACLALAGVVLTFAMIREETIYVWDRLRGLDR